MASKHETVVQAVIAALEQVTAGVSGYMYTPDDVQRVMFFPDNVVPDATLETVYLLRPGLEQRFLGPENQSVTYDLELFLVVARRMSVVSENPSGDEDPQRWMLAADLVADATYALYAGFFPGGSLTGNALHFVDHSFFVDYDRYATGWALAEIRFQVRYRTDRPGR